MTLDKIHIVSWLLTRRCNLKCNYCSIVRDYEEKPKGYPSISDYYKNEMSNETIIDTLKKIKNHNPDCFHLFYGGEPTIRWKDLIEIINFCNNENIHYTIITNGTMEAQQRIITILDHVEYIQGITTSIDPINPDLKFSGNSDDRWSKKCLMGDLANNKKIKDVVAEITVDSENIKYLYNLVEGLTKLNICSDITTIDVAYNRYYDFSNIEDKSLLIQKSSNVLNIFNKLQNSNFNIHMKDSLLGKIYYNLPSDKDCDLENFVHNLTIDADGSIRLCLRIRGEETPLKFNSVNFMDDSGKLDSELIRSFRKDKEKCCEGCNWTCIEMSKLLAYNEDISNSLIHSEKRGNNAKSNSIKRFRTN